jgi:hypothetical protein
MFAPPASIREARVRVFRPTNLVRDGSARNTRISNAVT